MLKGIFLYWLPDDENEATESAQEDSEEPVSETQSQEGEMEGDARYVLTPSLFLKM